MSSPLEGEKILITGVTGALPRPIALRLAEKNEVFGVARFTNPDHRRELEDAGVHLAPIDLEKVDLRKNDFDAIPTDVSIVLHFAYTRRASGDFQGAIQVNAVGAGRLLAHCQSARAALVVSAATLYSAHDDPYHAYQEEEDIGFVHAPWAASSPVSKVTLESTAQFCAQLFDLPTTIARPSVPYGLELDMTTLVLDSVRDSKPVFAANDPQPLSLIHVEDMIDQIPALLEAASVPARIVNWASDEVLTVQEIAALAGEIYGTTPTFQIAHAPGVAKGAVVDTHRVRDLVGPCRRQFREELPRILAARSQA